MKKGDKIVCIRTYDNYLTLNKVYIVDRYIEENIVYVQNSFARRTDEYTPYGFFGPIGWCRSSATKKDISERKVKFIEAKIV